MMKKPKGLGRGLEVLLGGDESVNRDEFGRHGSSDASTDGPIRELPLNQLQAGRYQPRTRMDETALQELADSIQEHGLLQPILVRPIEGERYEIIAGERRFRAAALAQLRTVPVIVRDVDDKNALTIALIENIQREDLNPLEEALAIKRLIDEFSFTHEQTAQAIGRSRSATSNILRLLNLAGPVQTLLQAGDLEMGHARALLSLERAQQILVAHQIVQRRLSVRETERLVARTQAEVSPIVATDRTDTTAVRAQGRDVARYQDRLADALGAKVEILTLARGRGKLVIHFSGSDAFSNLIEKLHLSRAIDETLD